MHFSEIVDILLEAGQSSNFNLYLRDAEGKPLSKVSQIALDYVRHIASLLTTKELNESQLDALAILVGLEPEIREVGYRRGATFDTGVYEPPVTSTTPIQGKYGNIRQNVDWKPKRVGADTVAPYESLPTSMGYKAGEQGQYKRRTAAIFPSYYTKVGRIGQDEIPAKVMPSQGKLVFGVKTDSLKSSTEERKQDVIAVGFGKIIKQTPSNTGSAHAPGDPGINLNDVMKYMDTPKENPEPPLHPGSKEVAESIIYESEGPMEQWALDYLDKGWPYWVEYDASGKEVPLPAEEILNREKYLTSIGKLPNPKRPKKLTQTAKELDKSLSRTEPEAQPEAQPEAPASTTELETPEADAAYSTADRYVILPLEPVGAYNQEVKARTKVLIFPEKYIDINYKLLESGPVQHLRDTGKIKINAQSNDIWRIRNLTVKNIEIPTSTPVVQLKYGQVVYVDKETFDPELLKMYDLQIYQPEENRKEFDLRVRNSLWAAPAKISVSRFNREREVARKLKEFGVDFEIQKSSGYNLGKVTVDKTETITYFVCKFAKPYTEYVPTPEAASADAESLAPKKKKKSSLGDPIDMDTLDKTLRDLGLSSSEETPKE